MANQRKRCPTCGRLSPGAAPRDPRGWDGEALRRARRAADLSQTALADEAGFTEWAVRDWEKGRTVPDDDTRRWLANHLKEPKLRPKARRAR